MSVIFAAMCVVGLLLLAVIALPIIVYLVCMIAETIKAIKGGDKK